MPATYLPAEIGGVSVLISSIDTSDGRDVAVLSPVRGSRHVLRDRGRKHRSARVELLFIDQPGLAPYTQRFHLVRSMVDEPASQIFAHPLLGTYRVRISDFDHRANADSLNIEVSCTLLPEDEPTPVFPAGAGVSAAAGVEAVEVAAFEALAALDAAARESSAPDDCTTTVQGWSEASELDPQQVFLEAASRVEELNEELEELSADLTDWPTYRAFCVLRYQVTRAAESFTSEAERLLEVTVGQDSPLLAICAELYPASIAVERARQVAKLNRVRTPGRVPAGTVLKMPSSGVRT